MQSFPDKSVDLILCDLPYGTTACSWDTVIPFEPLWEQYKRIIKDNAAIVLWGSQPFTTDLINSNRKWFKYEWIWDKYTPTGFLNSKRQPLKQHENICIFYTSQPIYNPIMVMKNYNGYRNGKKHKDGIIPPGIYGSKIKKMGDRSNYRYPKTIISIDGEKGYHPTQKPVALCEYLILTYSNEGDLVLDNACGSGTTCVAAKRLKRHWIGIELEPKYVEIARRRVEQCQEPMF
jgi:site-specific DNA-methyltransferase (adenine-specific)